MKKSLLYLISCFIKVYSYVYKICSIKNVPYVKARIYTIFLSNYLNSIGKGTCIYPPLSYNGLQKVNIGKNSLIGKCSIINAVTCYLDKKYDPTIEIGDYVDIGEYAHISSICRIVISNNVLTGRWLTIVDNSHGRFVAEDLEIRPTHRKLCTKGEVFIGDHVWIGDKVSVMPGVSIGRCSIIGSNSVVTHDIPDYSLAVGVPAKVVKRLE